MLESTQARLERQIEILTERNRQLEDLLLPSGVRLPVEWMLSPKEARLFAHLTTREMVTKQNLMDAIYFDLHTDDEPTIKIIDVFICKVRKKLKPFGIEIETVWGQGYSLKNREHYQLGNQLGAVSARADLRAQLQIVADYVDRGDMDAASTSLAEVIHWFDEVVAA